MRVNAECFRNGPQRMLHHWLRKTRMIEKGLEDEWGNVGLLDLAKERGLLVRTIHNPMLKALRYAQRLVPCMPALQLFAERRLHCEFW